MGECGNRPIGCGKTDNLSMIPYIHVEVLRIGPLPLQPFGILVATGVAIGIWLSVRRARQLGVHARELHSFITWILLPGFIGGHVFDSIFYHPQEVMQHPETLVFFWYGLSSFGGFLGALLGAFAWKYYEGREVATLGSRFYVVRPVRRPKSASILPLADVIMSVFPVAWIFGRTGCAIVHDHPGARASRDSWLAVAYGPGPVDRFGFIEFRHGVEPRYDLGLLEMMFTVVLATGFALTWRRGRASGWYVVAACTLYAPVRFALDFLRVEDAEGGDARYAGLTPAQWACTGLFCFGIALALYMKRRKQPFQRADSPVEAITPST